MEALIQVMESTIALRDPYTVGHQQRVARIACTIGREMGLSDDHLRDLRIAGTLHDLGKIAIPSSLLSKPGQLSILEFALLKTHPQVAYNILKPIELPGLTAEIILQHHERLNGSGYPQGLQGDEILMEARILGVADVMEAMCSHRPYRASLGLAEALEELTRNKGILYDATVVDACQRLYGQESLAACQAEAGLTTKAVASSPYLGPAEDEARAHDKFIELSALPRVKSGQPRNWSRFSFRGPRAWMHLGMTSFLGLMMSFSFRGF